ncbi:hypothetical protein ACN4EK_28585 [Pantanalinema rosaneae CENA516]|uniref:hypothetical protein n=1 Tax=Pantanalinema rosaneae TaxID=1620701 RepID=UPI003D6F139A
MSRSTPQNARLRSLGDKWFMILNGLVFQAGDRHGQPLNHCEQTSAVGKKLL